MKISFDLAMAFCLSCLRADMVWEEFIEKSDKRFIEMILEVMAILTAEWCWE